MRSSLRTAVAAIAVLPVLALLSPVTVAQAEDSPVTAGWAPTPNDLQPVVGAPAVVPVFTCAKPGACRNGLTVTIIDADGVRRTTTTGTGAVGVIRAEGLATPARVEVRIPRIARKPATLVGYITNDLTAGADIDLVSTVAARLSEESRLGLGRSLTVTKRGLGIPENSTFMQRLAIPAEFDAAKFLRFARNNGGVDAYINNVIVPGIMDGRQFNFAGTDRTTRGLGSDIAAELLVSAATAYLGDYLGLPNPAEEIQKGMQELVNTIISAFTQLTSMVWYTTVQNEETQYYVETSKLSDVTTGTTYAMKRMNTLAYTDPSIDGYDELQTSVYNDIVAGVSSEYSQYQALLPQTTGTSGVLQAGHDIWQQANQYYTADDVDQIQEMVGYWAAMAAQSNLLMVNAMAFAGNSPAVINAQNSDANDLYTQTMLAYPDTIADTEIGSWAADEAYSVVGSYTVPKKSATKAVYQDDAKCTNYKQASSSEAKEVGVNFVSTSTVAGWWNGMVNGQVDPINGEPYTLASGSQASAILPNLRSDGSTAQDYIAGVASSTGTGANTAVTTDSAEVFVVIDMLAWPLGFGQYVYYPEYDKGKLCTGISLTGGGINTEIKYDNTLPTTAFVYRGAQLTPRW